ncbi:hypothetical protein BCY88_32985 [Paraburkholderia fungorum]|uniref:Uncharacterized protein n=1 Tax=Paraburkholderia fungorum TaxID=134537 RepID=A0A3R7HF45_9BURK|nr:hypothetical protein BCY88_32985 [Paraburkholderia fungorum]
MISRLNLLLDQHPIISGCCARRSSRVYTDTPQHHGKPMPAGVRYARMKDGSKLASKAARVQRFTHASLARTAFFSPSFRASV